MTGKRAHMPGYEKSKNRAGRTYWKKTSTVTHTSSLHLHRESQDFTPASTMTVSGPVLSARDPDTGMIYRSAISLYRAPDEAASINDALRSGRTMREQAIVDGVDPEDRNALLDADYVQKVVTTLKNLLQETVTSNDSVVYRGCKIKDIPSPGDSVIDNGFLSATTDRDIASGFATAEESLSWSSVDRSSWTPSLLVIDVPEGSNVIDTQESDVKEFILAPGSHLRIRDVQYDDKLCVISAEIVDELLTS